MMVSQSYQNKNRIADGRVNRPPAFALCRVKMHRGFTLVELLVVVAIIAVLSGISAVVFQSAKVAANRAKCASNMRQLGVGIIMHAQENHGRLPASQHLLQHGSEDSWVFAMQGMLQGDIDELRICPADPKGPDRARNNASSYILNDYLDGARERVDAFGRTREVTNTLNTIPRPSQTLMLFIISDRKGTGTGNDHIHGAQWNSWARVLADIQPDRHRRGDANADHTKGSANYLYVDGRVESIDASVIKSRIDRGINIARPPK